MIPPQAARSGGRRSGGVSPVPPPLRSNFLSGEVPSVEPGGAPLGVTSLGFVVLGVLAALVFCLAVWGVLWTLGHGLFIAALIGVIVAFAATAVFRKK